MNDADDETKSGGDAVIELQPEMSASVADDSTKSVASIALQKTEDEPLKKNKNDDVSKEKEVIPTTEEDTLNTVRLVGEPLVAHGPYTFYGAFAYRQSDDVTRKNRRRGKKQQVKATTDNDENATVTELCDSSSSCCCSGDDVGNNACTCDDGSSSSLISTQSEWSVIHMNHFYAVRPWYSKKNSSSSDRHQQRSQRRNRKNSPIMPTSTGTEQPQQHHHQQSVCIGELELLWRDDSVITSTTMSSTSSSSSSLKKRSDSKSLTVVSNGSGDGIETITSSHGIAAASSDDDDGGGNYDGPTTLLPRRRLPRRTRQPSAKKLEAAESYAAAVAASALDHQPPQQLPYRRNQLSATSLNPTFASGISSSLADAQYKHGNLLCSVRLYVMPDQTATGRLGGVHGEDEVLEINTWGGNGGIDRWPNNVYMNSGGGIGSSYNSGSGGIDDYGYGSGSHSSGTLPSGCSGLVLRAEDFVEWIRGGMMNDDDENEESEDESTESECVNNNFNEENPIKKELPEQENDQQKLSPLATKFEGEIKMEKLETCHDDEMNKVKFESTMTKYDVKKEVLITDNPIELKTKDELSSVITINLGKEQKETVATNFYDDNDEKSIENKFDDNNYYSKSTVDEAIEAEHIPLAAAKINKRHSAIQHRRHHCRRNLNSKSLVNGGETSIVARKHDCHQNELKITTNKEGCKHNNTQICYCCCCKRRRNDEKKNTCGINKQQLVVMSYSRYCRYRAQLQRKREEQLNKRDIAIVTNGDIEKNVVTTYQGIGVINTTRVLFCRDTYDYPAELLLEPFNAQQCQQQNTSVLVNHLAPKLKGWPAYPASWMSFRWNRVRRRLRHLERGSGSNDDQRRRRRRRKLKKKCQRQNEASGVIGAMNYSSSSEDDESDNSDSDDASSATNDATTNTTTTASTSDSDCTLPPSLMTKTVNKNHSSVTTKVNGGVHHNKKAVTMANNIIAINGVNTTVSTATINKRPAITIQQLSQQNPIKRRRVVYSTQGKSQHQNQLQRYQQQQQNIISRQPQQQCRPRQSEQLNQHMLVVQQHQQRLHSFNQRLSTSYSPLQSSSARIIHHHLPPSVSIMPVIMSTSNIAAQQQRFNNRLQNRQKPQISVTETRQKNNNDRQQTITPVIEYDKHQEFKSDDNGRYKKSTITYHKHIERHNLKGDQSQQQEDDRQRRWLVDALRLGGLEVTAVPLNIGANRGNNDSCSDSKDISTTPTETLQQQRRRQRGISFESLPSTDKKHPYNGDVVQNDPSHGDGGDDESNPNSDFNSEIMTITPDVLSMLDKSEHKHQLMQKTQHHHRSSLERGSTSMILASTTQQQQQRRRSINIHSNSNNNSSQQPHSTKTAVAAAALHDKIYRAIDSLKQQQKQQQNLNISTSINKGGNNVIVMGGTNYHLPNSDNNYRQQQRRQKNDGMVDGIRQQPQTTVTPALLDLTVKSLVVPNSTTTIKQQRHLSLSPTINPQLRKIISPFQSNSTTAAANLEITIVPVTATTAINSTRFLSQQQQQQHKQKHSSTTATRDNSSAISETVSSSPLMTVRQQLQQRNIVSTSTSSTTSASFVADMLCGGRSRQQRNVTATSVSTTTTTSQEQPQQQQILLVASTAVTPATSQQIQNVKRKPQ